MHHGNGAVTAGKRQHGQFFTSENPFTAPPFEHWARSAALDGSDVLEPFAGSNSLIDHLEGMDYKMRSTSYDISPADDRLRVQLRDTLTDFPTGFDICVTNPPWLAKNSATARGLDFPSCGYDDLYKFALELCLHNCAWVAALVPESFIRAGVFHDRLTDFVSMPRRLFDDTGHPTGLALFAPEATDDVVVWSNDKKVGSLAALELFRPHPRNDRPTVRFNDPNGNVGLIAMDNTEKETIRYCPVEELAGYTVKHSSRFITKVQYDGKVRIDRWNRFLAKFRQDTYDVLMTCYRGVRKDGMFRRRLDWNLARGIMHNA